MFDKVHTVFPEYLLQTVHAIQRNSRQPAILNTQMVPLFQLMPLLEWAMPPLELNGFMAQ